MRGRISIARYGGEVFEPELGFGGGICLSVWGVVLEGMGMDGWPQTGEFDKKIIFVPTWLGLPVCSSSAHWTFFWKFHFVSDSEVVYGYFSSLPLLRSGNSFVQNTLPLTTYHLLEPSSAPPLLLEKCRITSETAIYP